jgi:hypothetical protein
MTPDAREHGARGSRREGAAGKASRPHGTALIEPGSASGLPSCTCSRPARAQTSTAYASALRYFIAGAQLIAAEPGSAGLAFAPTSTAPSASS